MRRQLASEIAKLRTTRTVAAVLAAMVALVAAAMVLHAYGLPVDRLAGRADQRGIMIDVGMNLGGLFAALLGALSITAEIRSGTIRPTLLVMPRRRTVVLAKALTTLLVGAVAGLVATTTAAAVGSAALDLRGIEVQVTTGDVVRLLAAGPAAGALLAVLGLAVGTLLRSQVPTLVGIFAWLLFVENVLMDVPSAHRFVTGALGQAIAGQDRAGVLDAAGPAAALLAGYAVVAVAVAVLTTERRDFA